MGTDDNLLFGVVSLQNQLIEAQQFVEACILWVSAQTRTPLAQILVERGWLSPEDRLLVAGLVARMRLKGQNDGTIDLPSLGYNPLPLEEVEKSHIHRTLEYTSWNKSQAASILNIQRTTLDRKIKLYGLKPHRTS